MFLMKTTSCIACHNPNHKDFHSGDCVVANEILALQEELAHEQAKARALELRQRIVVCERAMPYLRGIPRLQNENRIAADKDNLATCEMLIRLYKPRDTTADSGRWG